MNQVELDFFVQFIKEGSELNFKLRGRVEPMFFLLTPEGMKFLPVRFTSADQKQLVSEYVKASARELRAMAVGHVSECYTMEATLEEAKALDVSKSLRNHPNRVEQLYFSIESKDGKHVSYSNRIDRLIPGNEKTKGTLQGWVELKAMTQGRMANWFESVIASKN